MPTSAPNADSERSLEQDSLAASARDGPAALEPHRGWSRWGPREQRARSTHRAVTATFVYVDTNRDRAGRWEQSIPWLWEVGAAQLRDWRPFTHAVSCRLVRQLGEVATREQLGTAVRRARFLAWAVEHARALVRETVAVPLSAVALDALDAHVAYFRAFTQRSGGTVVDQGGIVSWHSRHPMGFLVNAIFRVDPAVDAAAVLREADRRFVTGYEVVTAVGRDDDLFDLAVRLGAHGQEPDPIQVLADPSSVGKPTLPPSIELRTVTDTVGVADVARVNREATTLYGFPDDLFPTLFADPASVLAEDVEAVVAYARGQPVATAQVFFHGISAYVGWVATTAAAMRGGLGTLVTRDVIARACLHGASTVSLMASPMGAPVYRRIGFSDVAWLRGAARAGGSSHRSR